MNRINQYYPVAPVPEPPVSRPETQREGNSTSPAFKEILAQQLQPGELQFSSHCLKRLEQNDITLDSEQVNKLKDAVQRAETKGSRDSCIVMDDMAFIVNVVNRTVVTVVEGERMKDNVFTNIDSAVIV